MKSTPHNGKSGDPPTNATFALRSITDDDIAGPRKKVRGYFRFKDGVWRPRMFDSEEARDAEKRLLWRLGELYNSPAPCMFDALVERFLKARPDDRKAERYLRIYITAAFGGQCLAAVRVSDIERLLEDIGLYRGKATTDAVVKYLRYLFFHAINAGWMTDSDNPMLTMAYGVPSETRHIRMRKVRQKQLSLPSLEDISRIVAHANGVIAMVFLLAIFAGLRGQEIRALRYRHIRFVEATDEKASYVEIDVCRAIKTKTNIEHVLKTTSGARFVRVGGLLYAYFKHLCSEPRELDELVCPGANGKIFTAESLSLALHIFQVSAGVGERLGRRRFRGTFGLHMFRHAAVALWIWSGMREEDISRQLGHVGGTVSMALDVYGYLFAAQLANPVEWPTGDVPIVDDEPEHIDMEMGDVEYA